MEEEKEKAKAMHTSLNNLFAGKGDGEEPGSNGEEEDYASKMNKKEKKKFRKDRKLDKIGTKDARVLTGGMTYADNAEAIKKLESNKVSAKSKKIKKNAGAHEITKEKVVEKLKNRRLAIPQSRFKA